MGEDDKCSPAVYLVNQAIKALKVMKMFDCDNSKKPVRLKKRVWLSAAPDDDRDGGRPGVGLLTRTKLKPKKPAMFRVLLLNDDFTPMDFVVHILEKFFAKNRQEATEIMLHVHRRGVGICGVYTHEVAETKVNLVMDYARKNEHPLQCTMEKE